MPFDLIVGAMVAGADPDAVRSIKIVRVFRLFRLLKLARLLKLKKLSASLAEVWSPNPALSRLIKLIVMIVFIAHLLSCVWFGVGSPSPDGAHTTWVTHVGIADADSNTQYAYAYYWTVATMMARADDAFFFCFFSLSRMCESTAVLPPP